LSAGIFEAQHGQKNRSSGRDKCSVNNAKGLSEELEGEKKEGEQEESEEWGIAVNLLMYDTPIHTAPTDLLTHEEEWTCGDSTLPLQTPSEC